MISRSYTWIDESEEHSDLDVARATALATKWSALQTEEENRYFACQSAEDELGYGYDPYEDCECDACMDDRREECEAAKADKLARDAKQAERELEIELVEDKLAAIGARMMRPYEHWNEDERYMQYMENRSEY